jgi:hypothetical protein
MNESLKMSLKRNCLELIARYKAEQVQLAEKISAVEKDLAAIEDEDDSPPKASAIQRRAKGQNRKAVRLFFSGNPNAVTGVRELSLKIGIPTTSALRAVKQLTDKGFLEQTEDGLWRKKQS